MQDPTTQRMPTMKKIRLDLLNLRVESFETVMQSGEERGTVRAHSGYPCYTGDPCISAGAVDPCNTVWDATCGEAEPTCDRSCNPYVLCCATDGLRSCV
jgi:hypothetical protein